MADVQLENGYIRIATELLDEIIRRDFSKRQLAILHFIIRLSYGCQQKSCIVKKLNSFEVAGVYKTDIKKELKYLGEAHVINWDQKENEFSLNKNYEEWQINPVKGWDHERISELIKLNLSRKRLIKALTPDPKIVSKTLTIDNETVSKILTNLGYKVSKTLTEKLVKHLLDNERNHWESKDDDGRIDIIKDIYLKISTITTKDPVDIIAEKFIDLRTIQEGRSVYPTTNDYQAIARIVASGMPLPQTIKLLEQCFEEYKQRQPDGAIKAFKYCEKYIFDHYKALIAREQAREAAKGSVPLKSAKSFQSRNRGTKPIRTEMTPNWFDEDPYDNKPKQIVNDHESSEVKKKEINEILSEFRAQ